MAKSLEALAINVKRYRQLRNLSQDDLAGRVGITSQSISNIENAVKGVNFKTVSALATALGCEETDLFKDPNQTKSPEERLLALRWEIIEALPTLDERQLNAVLRTIRGTQSARDSQSVGIDQIKKPG